MWKYRYLREFVPDDALLERCNTLGEDGWSMIGPPRWVPPDVERQSAPGAVGVWCCFFKRTVSNREQLRAIFAVSPQETTP